MKIITVNSNSQILTNVKIGKDVKIYNFVNAYECTIGDGSKIGAFVEIQKGAIIGNNCKISSHSFICEGVHIADNVFVGHNVTFINDKLPRATNDQGDLLTDEDWTCIKTFVDKGASIGSGATILCGIRIGKGAMIGAGSVVTHDVDDQEVVAGNPARLMKQLNTNPA
jgi:acetyltransferase-like isoleucine patch superfamily enzyme